MTSQTMTLSAPGASIARRVQRRLLRSQLPPLRVFRRVARAYRDQVRRDTHALVLTQFARLDRALGATHARIRPNDPLEQLWQLPASPRPRRGGIEAQS